MSPYNAITLVSLLEDFSDRNVAYAIDASGSMLMFIEIIHRHLIKALMRRSESNESAKFNILQIGTVIRQWKEKMVKNTEYMVNDAKRWLARWELNEETNLKDGLLYALMDDECDKVFLFTDSFHYLSVACLVNILKRNYEKTIDIIYFIRNEIALQDEALNRAVDKFYEEPDGSGSCIYIVPYPPNGKYIKAIPILNSTSLNEIKLLIRQKYLLSENYRSDEHFPFNGVDYCLSHPVNENIHSYYVRPRDIILFRCGNAGYYKCGKFLKKVTSQQCLVQEVISKGIGRNGYSIYNRICFMHDIIYFNNAGKEELIPGDLVLAPYKYNIYLPAVVIKVNLKFLKYRNITIVYPNGKNRMVTSDEVVRISSALYQQLTIHAGRGTLNSQERVSSNHHPSLPPYSSLDDAFINKSVASIESLSLQTTPERKRKIPDIDLTECTLKQTVSEHLQQHNMFGNDIVKEESERSDITEDILDQISNNSGEKYCPSIPLNTYYKYYGSPPVLKKICRYHRSCIPSIWPKSTVPVFIRQTNLLDGPKSSSYSNNNYMPEINYKKIRDNENMVKRRQLNVLQPKVVVLDLNEHAQFHSQRERNGFNPTITKKILPKRERKLPWHFANNHCSIQSENTNKNGITVPKLDLKEQSDDEATPRNDRD